MPTNGKLRRSLEKTYRYQNWRAKVFRRDHHRCLGCGITTDLVVHHRNGFSRMLTEYGITNKTQAQDCAPLWDVANGELLCVPCHETLHHSGELPALVVPRGWGRPAAWCLKSRGAR